MLRMLYDILISGLVFFPNCSMPIKCNTLELLSYVPSIYSSGPGLVQQSWVFFIAV